MSHIRRNYHWALALAGIVSLVGAGVMAQKTPVAGIPPAETGRAAEGADAAKSLSAAFRRVAREAVPAIVSVETVTRRVANRADDAEEMLEGTPFGELFGQDPRLKEFFKQRRMPKRPFRQHSEGSGFIIHAQGIVVTNSHVVSGAETVKVKLKDGREFLGTDIKTDPRTDVAIVRIKSDEPLPTVKLGNSDSAEVGDWVVAIGSPFGLEATVTAGIVSAKGRGPNITEREDFIQTDAAINPGNSGGPLLNLDGEVIGVNTAISTRSGGYDGVGFAVPINMVRWVADQLITDGTVRRAYMGVAIQPISARLAPHFNVPVGKGAIVTDVFPGSPAEAAGLKQGDVVLKAGGMEVSGTRSLQSVIERLKSGSKHPLVVLRDGKEITLEVALKEMPKDFTSMASRKAKPREVEEEASPAEPKSTKVDMLGIDVADATKSITTELGYDGTVSGVVITSVKEDGPAANAALKEGMIITKVGNSTIRNVAELQAALKNVVPEKGVKVFVRTPRGGQYTVLELEKAAKP